MQPLTLEEFKELAKQSKQVAVFQVIEMGELTPVLAYRLLEENGFNLGMIWEDLHSPIPERFGYICFNPIRTVSVPYGETRDPLNLIRAAHAEFNFVTREEAKPFITLSMGYITYDLTHAFEHIADHHLREQRLPLCQFQFYEGGLAFDYEKGSVIISILAEVKSDIDEAYAQVQQKMCQVINSLNVRATVDPFCKSHSGVRSRHPTSPDNDSKKIRVTPNDVEYMERVEFAKKHIHDGDAFQIVLSRVFQRAYDVPPLEIYSALQEISPSPFMFYLPLGTTTFVGASPERMVSVRGKELTVNPIAGTKKRENQALETINTLLLNDQKERAEHMMLVDLARNDLGALSTPGSIQIPELLQVKHYAHISHITSTIKGKLQKNNDAFDALQVTMPAGTLSGAPKIRAMQIIAEIEKEERKLYGGAICRFNLNHDLESCIAIRTALLREGMAYVQTGAGIVFDSDPLSEANETRNKAQPLLDSIAAAQGEVS